MSDRLWGRGAVIAKGGRVGFARQSPRGLAGGSRRAGCVPGSFTWAVMAMLLAWAPAARAVAAGANVAAASQPSSAPAGGELLIFEDIPVVVSAARTPQPAKWLSVPVSVVTAEDMHYSGLMNLPELLRFVPGVDVLRVDRNRYSVGVRGFHEVFSDRLLTLVDGGVVDNPLFGGVEWLRLPILMEDIKRIEVVRGPGGAAWGANALTGAVNIITKEPEETQGWLASTTWNHFGDAYNHVRWGARAGKWAWRISAGYQGHESSDEAISHDDFRSDDFSRNWRFDGRAAYQASEATRLSFGLSYLNDETGGCELFGTRPPDDQRYQSLRAFARADRKLDDERSLYVQWLGTHIDAKLPLMANYCTGTQQLEGEYSFRPWPDHKASVGGTLKWLYANFMSGTEYDFHVPDEPLNEYWAGLYAIDRWQVTRRLALEAQLRGEFYSGTQPDWAGRVTGLYSLDDKGDHIVRVGAAKAYRAPSLSLREVRNSLFPLPSPPLPPGLYAVNYSNIGRRDNEETWSLEAGYTARILEPLTFRVDGYYQRFEDLISTGRVPDPLGLGRYFARSLNGPGATAWGGEMELSYRTKAFQVCGWYAFNEMHPDGSEDFRDLNAQQNLRAWRPAKHKLGATARLFLPHGLTLQAQFAHSAATNGRQVGLPDAAPWDCLNLAVTKELGEHAELLVGVSDVLNRTDEAVFGGGQRTAHETPGRTFFVRLQARF